MANGSSALLASSDKADMSIDTLIVNPGRMRILTALASEPRQEFVRLRGATHMTDGNLATHARRLHGAGLVEIDKSFRDGKPVTTFTLTSRGRRALQQHVEQVMSALTAASSHRQNEPQAAVTIEDDDNWID